MKGEIEVIEPGLFSTIQDKGRFGFLNYGVPLSGPMDAYAAALGNMILNNSPNDAVLEITQSGPTLKFHAIANIVITGGYLSPLINNLEIHNNRIYSLKPGEILSFGKRILGSRAYIAIQGGFKNENVLGSYSWFEGLTAQFRLIKGMKLYFDRGEQKEVNTTSGVKLNDSYLSEINIPAYPGPEFLLLSPELREDLGKKTFTLDSANNRMAIQLSEELPNDLSPIITGPVIPGTVQFTPSGKLIVLMRDCQTTGGYPRVLQVSAKGLNILAQKITGDMVIFELQPALE